MKTPKAALIGFLCLIALAPLVAQTRVSDRFSYPADADFLVLERRSVVPLTAGTDGPWTRIYGDGRVEVHRPAYMRDGGDYQAWLSLEDVDALVATMDRAGLMVFSTEAVKKKYMAAERHRLETSGEIPVASDAGTVKLTIRLEGYRSEGSISQRNFVKTISWSSLDKVVEWYPEIEELKAFHKVTETLEALARSVRGAAHRGETMVTLPK